jgi:thiol-disulfide isomerase/thioredoxin
VPSADRIIAFVASCLRLLFVGAILAGCASGTSSARTGSGSETGPSTAADSPGTTRWPGSSGPRLTAIAGTTLGGTHLSLGASPHGVVVLNVWASWCYPCRAESPGLAQVARETASRGITFIGLDEQDIPSDARQFAATVHSSYPSLIDSDGRLLASLRLVPSNAIPSTLVVLPNGHVAARIIGPTNAAQLLALLIPLETGS